MAAIAPTSATAPESTAEAFKKAAYKAAASDPAGLACVELLQHSATLSDYQRQILVGTWVLPFVETRKLALGLKRLKIIFVMGVNLLNALVVTCQSLSLVLEQHGTHLTIVSTILTVLSTSLHTLQHARNQEKNTPEKLLRVAGQMESTGRRFLARLNAAHKASVDELFLELVDDLSDLQTSLLADEGADPASSKGAAKPSKGEGASNSTVVGQFNRVDPETE